MIDTDEKGEFDRVQILGLFSLFVFYLSLRVVAWTNTVLLEDHDSVLYLRQIETYLTFDAAKIFALSPDSTPFYPFFGALFSLSGLSVETAARLTSLVFSIAVFGSCAVILKNMACWRATIISLLILSIAPYLIAFSISILSEPTYAGVVYIGLAYFLTTYRSKKLFHAFGLGLIFGLAFLNRTEGLMFLLVIPFLKFIFEYFERPQSTRSFRSTFSWTLAFVAAYVILAAPQIAVVSAKMDRFALNGRQVWAELLFAPDAESYESQIYGLDYDPGEINLTYLQNNVVPGTQQSTRDIFQFAETVLRNVDTFYVSQLGQLGGALLLAFAILGLLQLVKNGKRFEAGALSVFIVTVWAPGFLAAPVPRGMAIAIPCIAILAGMGIVYISEEISRTFKHETWVRNVCSVGALGLLGIVWSVPFFGLYLRTKVENIEYSLPEIQTVGGILRAHAQANDTNRPVITARKQYLSYHSDTDFVPLPYTDFNGLIRYCRLNNVEYIFLKESLITDFPFHETIRSEDVSADLLLVYSDVDSSGGKIDLYQVR